MALPESLALLALALLPLTLLTLTLTLLTALALLAFLTLLAALTLLPALPLLATLPLLALLALLARLPLLALLALLALLTVAVLLAKRFILQTLLLADDVAHLVQHLHGLLIALLLLSLRHAARLQRLQHITQLAQHILRLIARALACHVFQIIEHLVQIFLAQDLVLIAIDRRTVLRLLLHLLHELGQRLPQLLHQAFDLFVVGAIFERLRKLILGIAQAAFGRSE